MARSEITFMTFGTKFCVEGGRPLDPYWRARKSIISLFHVWYHIIPEADSLHSYLYYSIQHLYEREARWIFDIEPDLGVWSWRVLFARKPPNGLFVLLFCLYRSFVRYNMHYKVILRVFFSKKEWSCVETTEFFGAPRRFQTSNFRRTVAGNGTRGKRKGACHLWRPRQIVMYKQ